MNPLENLTLTKKFCEELQAGDPSELFGGYISIQEAAQGHAAWREDVYGDVQVDPHEVVAVCFGKARLKEYMDALEVRYGADWKGFRLYFMKSRNWVEAEGTTLRQRRIHHDVVFIPFGNDGTNPNADLIQMPVLNPSSLPLDHTAIGAMKNTTLDNGQVLNTSKPCPSYCS